MGALAQARPDIVPAAGAGQGSIFLLQVPDLQTGGSKVSVVEPLVGGSGGRPTKDGIDGIEFAIGFLRNIPVESIEADMPLRIRHYRLRPDSAGAGRYRGGAGMEIELQILAPEATITSRAMDRYTFRPWGRLGGRPGATGYTLLNPGTQREVDIGKIDVLHLEFGDVLRIGTPGGGGYGDPLERDPLEVAHDVHRGIITRRYALDQFGVSVDDRFAVDDTATGTRRAEMRGRRGSLPEFDFGPEREAYEQVWSDAFVTTANHALNPFPGRVRTLLRERLCRLVDEATTRGERPTAADVPQLMERILQAFGGSGNLSAGARGDAS